MAKKSWITRLIRTHLSNQNHPLVVLDVGCGDSPYRDCFAAGNYVGIDIEESGRLRENKSPNIWFDGENIPFEDEKFDFVMATEVLEHAENPSQLFGEMIRCLKTGGTVLITVPTTWALHEEPYDFMRLTPYGVAKLGQKHGLRPIEVGGETRGLSAIRKILLSEIKRSRLSPVKEKFARALAKGFVKLLGSVSPDFSNALVITSYGVFEKHDS